MTSRKIGVVTVPIYKSGNPPLSHLLEILYGYSQNLYLLTGNDGYIFFNQDPRFHVEGWVYKNQSNSFVSRLFRYIWTQLLISYRIIHQRKNIDQLIFFFGGYRLHLPVIVSKLFNIEVILLLADSGGKHPGSSFEDAVSLPKTLMNFPYTCADKIVVYSPLLIHLWELEPYRKKIFIAHEHYLDFELFKKTTELPARRHLIGFLGRLSSEKGIRNFVEALPAVLTMYPEISILIGGDGPLNEEIKTFLEREKLSGHVEFTGWINHDDLPGYLNRLRLLVIPSSTEGLPNIVLEAMACGTPVLATPVGAIPDIVTEGETGFSMETNSPACISENIIRALHTPDIERIAENGRKFVQENYTFEKTAGSWRSVLEETKKNIP